jgi:predicted glycosyltransferase
MKKKILFYCQPVLGIGHFIRSREIIRGLRDFDVCFLNGGRIVEGFELPSRVEVVNLPAIKSDAEFQGIRAVAGERSLEEVKRIRLEAILAAYDRILPDILIVELFPFGRRPFAYELMPLIERAREGKAKIVCSLRDILVEKSDHAQFEAEVCDTVNRFFDLLLVHSDPQFQRLEETFYRLDDIACPIVYTGFVVPESAGRAQVPARDFKSILVSAGGGRVGSELLECAIAAAAELDGRLDFRMYVVTGPHAPDAVYQSLKRQSGRIPQVTIERFTTRFFEHLEQADLSISMAGYNTCMDLLRSGVRALVLSFTGHGNREQTIRARKLEKLGALTVIEPDDLTPARLADKIVERLAAPKPSIAESLDMNGVKNTAAALADLVG